MAWDSGLVVRLDGEQPRRGGGQAGRIPAFGGIFAYLPNGIGRRYASPAARVAGMDIVFKAYAAYIDGAWTGDADPHHRSFEGQLGVDWGPITVRAGLHPIEAVSKIDSTFAAVVGAFTFVTATIGINIVANFVSAAFDFSNIAPSQISWRGGGMLAACGAVFITPWNLFNSPAVIHYTLDVLGSFIGPLFGILIGDFYLVKKQMVDIDALYSDSPRGRYYYENGVNWLAIKALIPGVLAGLVLSFLPGFFEEPGIFKDLANFAWFIGAVVGGLAYRVLAGTEATAIPGVDALAGTQVVE